MELLSARDTGRTVDAFGSTGVELTRLAEPAGPSAVTLARLAPGGRIGRHAAATQQVLTLASGSAVVSGGDGAERELGPGEAVSWDAGELHETRSEGGCVALVVEAERVEHRLASR